MEKLVKMLNKYEETNKHRISRDVWYDPIWIYWYSLWMYWFWWASKCIIISKEYWFVKHLVEKDKIDYEKLNELNDRYRCLEPYEAIVMQLSISDDPIQDLISLLKNV